MKSVVIAHQTVIDGDAIGNDILGMYSCLKNEGYDVSIFADYYMGIFDSLKTERTRSLKAIREPNTIIIYHHSIFWEGGREFLLKCKGNIVFKYHNITPPVFFKKYSSLHFEKCTKGIEQTKEFIQTFSSAIWCSDSEFNSNDLMKQGAKKETIVTIPPFNQLQFLDQLEPDYDIISHLINNNKNNVLFIGRIAPNKGYIHLVNTISEYVQMYDGNIHLWMIGPFDNSLESYIRELNIVIKKRNLQNNITFTGKLPVEQVKGYYLACDEFLCMSEHEGFCVPIIEAQKMMLPVIASGTSAVPETAGENQLLLSDFDYSFAASALYTLYTEKRIKRFFQKNGLKNVTERFSSTIIGSRFMKLIQNISLGEYQ
jgi:glycosyltransferase involved in cell wall biosynthesis